MPFQLRQWSRQFTAVLLSMPVVESRKLLSVTQDPNDRHVILKEPMKAANWHPTLTIFPFCLVWNWIPSVTTPVYYGWRNGAKFTKFIFIHIQCCYCYSGIYLFTFNNRIYIQGIYLFTFTGVFLIHDYICSHLRDVFIHIQRVIFIYIHDRNIH